MAESPKDIWIQWLLNRRFGGNPALMAKMFEYLYPVRDRVLSHISLGDQETLLDVGCGDGLISFGALETFDKCRVIFSDISRDLLEHVETLAEQMGVGDRCRFIQAPADDLSMIDEGSVEAVTTRSVLIYVHDKQGAFNEFYRVLKPGGELSIFEPISSYSFPEPPNQFEGYDVTPVSDIARKLLNLYYAIQPPDSDPMGNFDERDLVSQAENAGFREIHLDLQIEVKPHESEDWSVFVKTAYNPKVPTLEEAMQQVLIPLEIERFVNHLRPLVETGRGMQRLAVAYLWAVK